VPREYEDSLAPSSLVVYVHTYALPYLSNISPRLLTHSSMTASSVPLVFYAELDILKQYHKGTLRHL
jgi:hypothetical protein